EWRGMSNISPQVTPCRGEAVKRRKYDAARQVAHDIRSRGGAGTTYRCSRRESSPENSVRGCQRVSGSAKRPRVYDAAVSGSVTECLHEGANQAVIASGHRDRRW